MTPLPSLDDLACSCGTDKGSPVHGYARHYERFFAPWRDRPVRLLEIGVGTGAALRLWQRYFPQGRICTLDRAEKAAAVPPGVTFLEGSQADAQCLTHAVATAGPFDIVIDDGSHLWAEQLTALRTLFPTLPPGGWYAVEDLHTSYWDSYRSGPLATVAFLKTLLDELNLYGRSGYGIIANDPELPVFQAALHPWQRLLGSLYFWKSLALLERSDAPAEFPGAGGAP